MSRDAAAIRRVGVVGAGTMGTGIAQLFLRAGCAVHLHDASLAQLEAARERIRNGLERWARRGEMDGVEEALGRLELAEGLVELQPCEWIVEAIVEEYAAKADVFRALGRLCHEETVLTTNTSSLSVTRLGAESGRPERFAGMHFFNPPPVMRLVEIVAGLRTAPDVVETAASLAVRLGKTPVVARDRPGFLSNRILMPMLNEAFWALEEGVGSAKEIDTVMKLGMNHPMGPLELADFIGLDVCLAILEALHRELGDPKFRPCPLLRKHVEAGWLGRKTGRGVYEYPPERPRA